MKKLRKILVIVLIILVSALSSCMSVYFNEALPGDSEDLETIPRKFRGTWVQDNDTITIGTDYFRQIEWESNALSEKEVDSNEAIIIRGNKIYDIENDSLHGYGFTKHDDSVYINIPLEFGFTLGPDAKLRSANKNYYLINVKKDSIWWDVFLVQKLRNDKIIVRYPNEEDISILESILDTSGIELEPNEDDEAYSTLDLQSYWNVGINAAELIQFIEFGGFSDTTLILEKKYQIE